MLVSEYIKATKMTIYALARDAKLSYTALWRHLHGMSNLSRSSARALEDFDPRLSASEILLHDVTAKAKSKATKRRAA